MTTAATYTNRGRIEGDRLTRALINAAARGVRPRCGDYETSYMWLSEDAPDRQLAALMCVGCVVLDPCREVGRYQTFGVYGAVDVTRRPGRKLQRDDAATHHLK
jgi:hypothetical protein